MARRPHIVLALATVLGGLPEAAPAADLTIVWNVTTPRGSSRTQTHSISSSRIRTTDELRDVVVDAASGQVTVIEHRRKEYWQCSLDAVEDFLGKTEAALSTGSALEKTVGPLGPVRVEKGSQARRIAGYDTQPYTLTMGDSIRFEVWVAPALDPPPQVHDARRVVYATLGPMGTRFNRMLDEIRKLPGLPLALTIEYRMRTGPRQVVAEAQEVRPGPVPESVFAVPEGYRKVDSPFDGRRPSGRGRREAGRP